jgi:hypothetical protein
MKKKLNKRKMSKVKTTMTVPAVRMTGMYKGKSNKLGYGGRSQQLKDKGVPGGVIGNLARKAQAAPGQKNYHGKKKKKKKGMKMVMEPMGEGRND